jgi:hypothetical protein
MFYDIEDVEEPLRGGRWRGLGVGEMRDER